MSYAEINGQRILRGHGEAGPPVVLSHGFLMDREMFEPQVRRSPPVPSDHLGRAGVRRDGIRRATVHLLGLRPGLPRLARHPRHRPGGPRRHVPGRLSVDARGAAHARKRARARPDRHPVWARGPRTPPGLRQMQPTWLELGPVDELAQSDRRPDHRRSGPGRGVDREGMALLENARSAPASACSTGRTSPSGSARSNVRRSSSTGRAISRSRSTRASSYARPAGMHRER